jgi:hypothetical protein
MQPSRSFATDRKPRTMVMPPGSLSGRNFQPSFHSGMEAAYVGHPANPFQNRPARSGRSMSKLPVVGVAVCRRMSEFDHSTMSFTCRPSGAGPKASLSIPILCT